MRLVLLAVAMGLATSPALRGSEVTLTPAQDNTLYNTFTESSSGIGSNLFIGATGGGEARRAVLSFDVASALPAGATITSASLTLNANKGGHSSQTIELHRLSASWGEGDSNADTIQGGGIGAPASTGDATWLHRFYPDSPWANPGGDFSTTVSSSVVVSTLGPFTIPSSPAFVADVQSFLSSPSTNFGWVLIGDEFTGGSAIRVDSRESLTPSFQPTLTIDFSTGPLPGDANGDGRIDQDDFTLIDRGFARHLTGFSNGDFNGDNTIDSADYAIIDQAFYSQAQGFSPGFLAQRESQFGASYVAALTASVPEPASSLACVFAASLLAPRRRARRHR